MSEALAFQGLHKRSLSVQGGVMALPSRATFGRSRRTQFTPAETENAIVLVAEKSEAAPSFREVVEKASARAFRGGAAGFAAGVIQVMTFMWMRTTMNFQYANGGTIGNALSTLWKEGGIPRFYRGVNYAIVQAPLSRFGDTFANTGVLALFEAFAPGTPIALQTGVAAIGGATWRIFLTPVDTLKTTLQVQGREGMAVLSQKIQKGGLGVMYNGAFANFGANWVGNFPWFTTFNYLQAKIPVPEDGDTLKKLGRNAFIGICASAVSDCVSNSLRVLKTVKQTNPDPNIGYVAGAKMILEKEGIKGLLGRGLKARLITNIMQSMVFSVAWKAIEEQLNKPKAKPAAAVDAPAAATKAVWTLPPVAGLSMESDAKAVCVASTNTIDQTQLAAPVLV